jgi:hypothetical protein
LPELFVPCYLVEHPDGRLLWDAGVPAIVADSSEGMEMYGFFTTLDRTLADQLAELGIGISDVDLVAFSLTCTGITSDRPTSSPRRLS